MPGVWPWLVLAACGPWSAALAAAALGEQALPPAARAAEQARHHLHLELAPERGWLRGRDRIALAPGHGGHVILQLQAGLAVEAVTARGQAVRFERQGERLRLALPAQAAEIVVTYSGRPGASALQAQGSWLSGEQAWYPRRLPSDPLTVEVATPAGQRAVLTGALRDEAVESGQARARFEAYRDEPASLFAGPYAVQERLHRGLRLRTYFHEPAAALAPGYLDDVARHIDHFARAIGPYPYEGFAVVSAPHPVGLGYPGLTYVSRDILQLPFMRGRSLAHEIAHNWWGNAVGVGEGGNWAEGLTTFMADYGLADAPARAVMRLEWLRDYAALPAADDAALSRFEGKVHSRDQIVGYGKAAMVFHMLQRRLGEPAFGQALARFYARHRGAPAGWADLRAAFEAAGGQPLGGFFQQWIERVGAPRLALDGVEFGEDRVRFTLAQAGPPYALSVPVVVQTAGGPQAHEIVLDGARRTVEIATGARPEALHVDPDHDLFRHLAAGEAAPVLRDLTLLPQVQTVLLDVPPEVAPAARRLAQALLRAAAEPVAAGQRAPGRPTLAIGLGSPAHVAQALGLAAPELPAREASAAVWIAPDAAQPTVVVAARDGAALEALARPLPRYGREGWLLFSQAQPIERGAWRPAAGRALSARR